MYFGMYSLVKNTPYFLRPPLPGITTLLAISVPTFYFICLSLTANNYISVFQILFFLGTGLSLMLFCRIQNATSKQHFIRNISLVTLAALSTTIILNVTLDYWLKVFPMPKEFEETLESFMHVGSVLGLMRDILVLSLVPAICEEFFFRGFLQTSLSHLWGEKTALFATASFFALYHLNPWLLPFYFLLGILFGVSFNKTNNLGMAMIAHFINNSFGVVMFHLVGKS